LLILALIYLSILIVKKSQKYLEDTVLKKSKILKIVEYTGDLMWRLASDLTIKS
jgi:hypothetical protein